MNVRSALLAGTIASLAMDVAQSGIAAIFERGRARDDRDEEVEAVAALVDEIGKLFGRKPVYPVLDGHVLHYVFGAAFALGYGRVRERWPIVASGGGAAFGIALWIASDLILVRAIGLVRADRRYSIAERANALGSHLTYGMVLEYALRAVDAG